MSWTLGMTKARIRALLDDPEGSYLTDSFIVPLINQVYDDANSQLASTQGPWDVAVVECPGITPGTPNLQPFQVGTGSLAQLVDQPLRIDWKLAGADPSYYRLVRNYEVLPDMQPQQAMAGWEWRSEVIWLTRCSFAVDLRIRGEFAPAPLVEDGDVLSSHPRMGYVAAYGTSSLIAVVRGNKDWAAQYEQKAIEGLDEIMEQIVRATQADTRRAGRMSQRGRGGRGWTAYR